MSLRMLPVVAVVFLLLAVVSLPVHSSTGSTTILSVTPSKIQGSVGSNFSANVTLYLPSGVSIGSYDIVLKALSLTGCSPGCPLNMTGLQPGNIFPPGYIEAARCVNGVGMGCGSNDGGGVAHSAEAYTSSVSGPVSVTVFTVQFHVQRSGSVQLGLVNDTLVSGANAAQALPHASENGLFSNLGLTAFFNVQTAIPIVGRPVSFDASATFNPNNETADYRSKLNYSWSFGDGNTTHGLALSNTFHSYASIGSHDVRLVVTDEYSVTNSTHRTFNVVSALGTLQIGIVDQTGSPVNGNVTVSLFNGSILVKRVVLNPLSRPIIFSGLSEGVYGVEFSGPRVTVQQVAESVTAGWTTLDTVSLTIYYPPPPPISDPFLIELATIVGVFGAGILLGTLALVRRRRSKRGKAKKK